MKKFRALGLREAKRELALWLAGVQRLAVVRKRGRPKGGRVPTWETAVVAWLTGIIARPDLVEATKIYYRKRVPFLLALAPGATAVDRITRAMAHEWWQANASPAGAHHCNMALSVARRIFDDLKRQGLVADDPTEGIARLPLAQRRIELPTAAQFAAAVAAMGDTESARMVRFMAFSGLRISEACRVQWSDIEGEAGNYTLTVVSAKARGGVSRYRRIPAIAPLAGLIDEMRRLWREQGMEPAGPVFRIGSPRTAFENAMERVGCPRMRIHDLRHMFATRCIEAGVDVPTVSRWLGHSDGGALAMRTYGHLRDDHSRAQAQRVNF